MFVCVCVCTNRLYTNKLSTHTHHPVDTDTLVYGVVRVPGEGGGKSRQRGHGSRERDGVPPGTCFVDIVTAPIEVKVRVCVYVCVCVCVRESMCVCVCERECVLFVNIVTADVCVYERERECVESFSYALHSIHIYTTHYTHTTTQAAPAEGNAAPLSSTPSSLSSPPPDASSASVHPAR
jgi:hypothetical protein